MSSSPWLRKNNTNMGHITDADYYIPHVFAVSPLGEASNGTTAPVIIRGIDEKTHDESSEYYLKPFAAQRMSPNASMFELLAALMAKQIDLNVAEPVLINVSPDFVELCRGKEFFQRISKSVGINFGSKNFGGGFVTWLPETVLPYNLIEQALKIFVFDIMIQNTDRGHQKANLNTNGKELKIFDHELAFSYTGLIGVGASQAWQIQENGIDKDLVFKHLFFKHLRKKGDLPVDKAIESLEFLNDEFWQKAKGLIPGQWMSNNFQKIKEHTESIVKNLTNFKNEIKRVLS